MKISNAYQHKNTRQDILDGEPDKKPIRFSREAKGDGGRGRTLAGANCDEERCLHLDSFLRRRTHPFGQTVLDVIDQFNAAQGPAVKALSNRYFDHYLNLSLIID